MNEENTVSTEAVADDWDDIDLSDVADTDTDAGEEETPAAEEAPAADTAESAEADPAQAQEAAEPEGTQTEAVETAGADQSFTLKYMGEERSFNREDTIALAQKGMDYDRIRGKLTEQTALAEEGAKAIELVKLLAADTGLDPEAFAESARANSLSKREGISIDEAKGRLRLERREAELSAREKALEDKAKAEPPQPDEKEQRQKDFIAFFKARPDVKAEDIPKEVFQRVRDEKLPLLAAYTMYENTKLRAELETARQMKRNAERSVGSGSTSGKRTPADEFDAAWYDGT